MASIDRENPEFLAEIQRREAAEEQQRTARKFERDVSFNDLDSDLDAEIPTHATADERTFFDAQVAYATKSPNAKEQDKCRACNGTGKFYSKYTGRVVGDCFRCKGTASVSKGTNERVEKARATKARNEAAVRNAQEDWYKQHTDVLKWIWTHAEHNSFAQSLLEQYNAKRTLSIGQVTAVRNNVTRAAQREAERANTAAATEPAGSGLDLSKIPAGTYAVPGGDTRLKVKIDRPEPPSKWAGWVFVSDGAEYGLQRKYGRQAPGKTYTGGILDALTKIAADPRAAAAEYGRITGHCAVCGRKLEDEESVARGIGPICAGKF